MRQSSCSHFAHQSCEEWGQEGTREGTRSLLRRYEMGGQSESRHVAGHISRPSHSTALPPLRPYLLYGVGTARRAHSPRPETRSHRYFSTTDVATSHMEQSPFVRNQYHHSTPQKRAVLKRALSVVWPFCSSRSRFMVMAASEGVSFSKRTGPRLSRRMGVWLAEISVESHSLPSRARPLRDQHRGPMNESIAQRRQSLVGLRQRESAHLGANRQSRHEGEELFCIVTSDVRD